MDIHLQLGGTLDPNILKQNSYEILILIFDKLEIFDKLQIFDQPNLYEQIQGIVYILSIYIYG